MSRGEGRGRDVEGSTGGRAHAMADQHRQSPQPTPRDAALDAA